MFCSNEEAELFARKDLVNIYGSAGTRIVKAAPDIANFGYLQREAFGLKFVWDLTLAIGEVYLFNGSDGGMVVVEDIPLRNKDKMRCTVLDVDGTGKAEFRLVEKNRRKKAVKARFLETAT